jgi:hypothetical protein
MDPPTRLAAPAARRLISRAVLLILNKYVMRETVLSENSYTCSTGGWDGIWLTPEKPGFHFIVFHSRARIEFIIGFRLSDTILMIGMGLAQVRRGSPQDSDIAVIRLKVL